MKIFDRNFFCEDGKYTRGQRIEHASTIRVGCNQSLKIMEFGHNTEKKRNRT